MGCIFSVQFSAVAQSCPNLCAPWTACSRTGLPVHHQLPELTQTHVHWVSVAIQPSHPLSSPSPPTFNLSQHQGLFKWDSSSHQVAKVLEFQQLGKHWVKVRNHIPRILKLPGSLDLHSSVQMLSHVWHFATPWTAAYQASLSITNSRNLLKLMSIESLMPANHLSLCRPLLLLPQSFPASESFPMSQLFAWGGQSTGVSALASVLPKKFLALVNFFNFFQASVSSSVKWI